MDLIQKEAADTKLANELWFEKIGSRDHVLQKQAEDAVTAYTRTTIREDSFLERVMPSVEATNSDLVRKVNTDKPVCVVDKEGDSPAAVSVAFGTLPSNYYYRYPRYEVTFERMLTPRFTKDVAELRTYVLDIRQVISDNAIKDLLAEKDGKFIRTINMCLIGPDEIVPATGTAMWQTVDDGITRESLVDSLKIMPDTPFHLEVHTILANVITNKDLWKIARDEMGGDKAQDVMLNGWSMDQFLGKRWLFTIKKDLVPTGRCYQFADPKFIGKHYSLEAETMYVKQEAFMLEFFTYCMTGASIGHLGGIAIVDFLQVK
jgi:hypothetical protein